MSAYRKLTTKFFTKSQSLFHVAVWEVDNRKQNDYSRARVKTEICRNAYDDQSYLRAYLFGNSQWNLIVESPMAKETAFCHEVSYMAKNPVESLFQADAEALVKEIQLII